MSDATPKLRVIDEEPATPAEIVRLGPRGGAIEPVERLPGPASEPIEARLVSAPRELFDGRSQEPGVEAILDQEGPVANVEQPWGIDDGRLAGIPYGWFLLIAVLLAGAGAWSIHAMHRGEESLKVHHGAILQRVDQDKIADQQAEALVEEVERVVAAYLRAETIADLLPWVRQPERVEPLIAGEWRERPKRALEFTGMTVFQPQDYGGKSFWVVRAEVRDGEPQTLLVEQSDATGVKVDWETHVCHQPMAWDRFIDERPDDRALEFRVRVTPDSHHSHEFADSARWLCFRLTAKGSDAYLFGYALAGGAEAAFLSERCQTTPGRVASAILRLRVPVDCKAPRGVVIERIVSPQWVRTGDPGDDAP
jgi:hypothetical protein